MASKKLSKEDEKILRAYCSQMPTLTQATCEIHTMTGAELKDIGYVEDKNKPLIDDEKYEFRYPVILGNNHYRRLKKAWLKDGEPGLKKYFEGVKEAIDNHKKEQLAYAK
jgi:hypothetical protein